MSETIEAVVVADRLDEVQQGQETVLLALSPDELQSAHAKMRSWASAMAQLMLRQREDFQASLDIAIQRKWGSAALRRAVSMAQKRYEFYSKILSAINAGYLMVPNFEMTPWVVRTDRKRPSGGVARERWSPRNWFPQESERLPEGEGRYVAHNAKSDHESEEVIGSDGKASVVHVSWPTEFEDSPPFPMMFAAPYVMDRTARSVKELIFDEIGVSADTNAGLRRGDPFLLGRILNPRPRHPNVTFFIAWAMDLRRL